ncbi:YggS family pyridoxal phosphate-dependent enzyme [Sneathiella glossodoripedis]|uniref:YggS family pyridoxal phosphate-dependent enzyme n=1 Tax=Sneathiella glossodoripedis TaxID=418853 RepID=UPI0004727086|nr:YggS family pyridoxal phosphate-dependent enzyme [Sneathiella glossodoripedis]
MTDVSANLANVQEKIKKRALKWGQDPDKVKLIAVSKQQPLERVEAALQAGHRVFGENRVQEAQSKWPDFRSQYPDIELHLIGPLQSNKSAQAVALFDVIQTVDRPKIAKTLAEEMRKADRQIPVYIQVNIGGEPQKAGVAIEDADAFIEQCRKEYGLQVEGLMCIPPLEEQPAPFFALLSKIAKRNGLEKLSMGMSGDYEYAVQFGATSVRVGSAIFGERG